MGGYITWTSLTLLTFRGNKNLCKVASALQKQVHAVCECVAALKGCVMYFVSM